MRVLLSAYACEPNYGSEPEVGWRWALHLAQLGHDVVVLTRLEHRTGIEMELTRLSNTKLRFFYYDLPEPIRWHAGGGKLHFYLYYALWQWRAVHVARELHAHHRFDCVHHVTVAGVRVGSFMGDLGIPFIFGPVGGGDRAPWALRSGYSLKGWLLDALRDVANLAVRFDPLLLKTFARASTIYVTSEETLKLLPRVHRRKAIIELAIGIEKTDADFDLDLTEKIRNRPIFRVLYVGLFQYLKGMHLGIPAFAQLVKIQPNARLTMIGEGPEKSRWQKLAGGLGVADKIDWRPWLPRADLASYFDAHHAMLFPSLRDAGGMVVLESLARALPVVCLKIGGPGNIVTDECGRLVDVAGKSLPQVVAELGQALIELSDDNVRLRLARGAQQRSRDFCWRKKVVRIYGKGA